MKILHLIDYFQPEVGYQETFLACAHQTTGHQVRVITSDRYVPIDNFDATWGGVLGPRVKGPGTFVEEGLTVRRLPVVWEGGNSLFVRGLGPAIREFGPDVVILHNNESLFALQLYALLRAGRLQPTKLIVDNHANRINSNNHRIAPLYYWLYRKVASPILLRHFDGIVAIDDESREFLEVTCAIPRSRITKIRLGADPSRFEFSASARAQVRSSYGISEDDVVFLQVGKLEVTKRPDVLLAAFAEVVEKRSDCWLMLVGSCAEDYWQGLERLHLDNETVDRVIRVGTVDNKELYSYYSAGDVAIWAGAPTAGTLEAQSVGCPLIVADSRLLLERIGGENGLSFKEGDAEDLARAMMKLADDPGLRRWLSEQGRRELEEELNWEALAARFLELVL